MKSSKEARRVAIKERITILYEEADIIRALVTTEPDGTRDYDRAGRVLVGLLNLFGTGMCGIDTDPQTTRVLGCIAERLVSEERLQIERDKKRTWWKGRGR
jgi:hypothetical protein